MGLQVFNTRKLIEPENLKLKILVYSLPGVGKTTWLASTADVSDLGVLACETGQGQGLLPVAQKGLDYIPVESIQTIEAVASGMAFKEKGAIGVDSLSEMARTHVKDYALTFPRTRGNTNKRQAGVPELDDYGVMGEITRRLVRKFLDMDKHIIFTATERYDKPDPDTPGSELLIGPDLPGQMFLGSTAMFDFVLRLRTRPKLRDPKDAKSRYEERYFITQSSGSTIAKSRASLNNMSLLPGELVFDPQTGTGTFGDILQRVQKRYREFLAQKPEPQAVGV